MTLASPFIPQHLPHDPIRQHLSEGQEQNPTLDSAPDRNLLLPPQSLRCHIIRPTLVYLGVSSNAAEDLLLGTLLAMAWLPADKHCRGGIGPYAISAAVHTCLWDEYLALQPDLASLIRGLASQRCFLQDPHAELAYNLAYATAIAWMFYQQQAVCLDSSADTLALARVWHRTYPHQGASERDFIRSWQMTHGDRGTISA